KPNIFTNQEVFQIICNEDDTFYTSCKRISLIFELIKRVINLLESHIANLANCFIGIVQIAVALKRISISNNFHTLAIATFDFRYQQFDISLYLLTYYLYPNYRNKGLKNEKFIEIGEIAKSIENENLDLQELAKTMFTIVSSQNNLQLHSFYISNIEKELKLYNFVEMELHNSALNEMIFAKIDNLDLNNIDLSDPIFGADNNQVESILTEEETEETSIEFESRSLVWDMLSD
ncbi:4362_t:CDS:2, partial [Gigaspora margarita]